MSIPSFLDWCSNNGIIIDPRIHICHNEERGVHVVAKEVSIPLGDTLVWIPKDAVLSAKSCSLSDRIPFELHGLGAQLGLAFALYSEILLNKHSSRWFGYLQSLPSVDLPLFWEFDPRSRRDGKSHLLDPDPEDLLLWFRGTEVMKLLHKKDGANQTVPESIDHYYHHTALPILLQPDVRDGLSQEPDLAAFRKAYSLVSSRAFFLDSYHGLAMTPVADAFNHALENHVHIESEFFVCPECGSFRECEHDSDDDGHRIRSSQWMDGTHDLYYEMVSNVEIQPNEEVFNTYGEGLCNAQLLVQYGFILDPNDNDVLNFDTKEILSLFSSPDANLEVPLFEDADLISHNDLFKDSDLVFPHTHFPSKDTEFCIDSDGKISFRLWIFLLKHLCRSRDVSSWFRTEVLLTFITTQAVLENIIQDGQSDSTENGNVELDPARIAMLVEIAQAIVRLCEMRKLAIGHPNHAGENLGELLDAVPEDRRRFRLALSVLMVEHSILDSCRFKWLDFVATFGLDI